MREIKLTQGKVAFVDDENYEWLNQFTWHAHLSGHNWYAVRHLERNGGYGPIIGMHRVILNSGKGMEVDHIDGNGLNNQRSNLRLCTRNENAKNRFKIVGISKFKGVGWHHKLRKWRSRINVDGKSKFLGCFNSEIEAAIAYDIAAKKYHGEFARLNF